MKKSYSVVLMCMLVFLVAGCTDLIPQPQSPGEGPLLARGSAHILEIELLRPQELSNRFDVRISGVLPTPCHELEWDMTIAEEQGRVMIEVFTLYDPAEICIQIEEAFDLQVPVVDLAKSEYTIWVNDEPVGSIDLSGSVSQTRDPSLYVRGPVYIDRTEILLLESYPVQVRLNVVGNLPTPCHDIEWDVQPPDADGRIDVELYSLTKAGGECIQVLEPFDEQIPVGDFTEGSFSVWLNRDLIGEFDL